MSKIDSIICLIFTASLGTALINRKEFSHNQPQMTGCLLPFLKCPNDQQNTRQLNSILCLFCLLFSHLVLELHSNQCTSLHVQPYWQSKTEFHPIRVLHLATVGITLNETNMLSSSKFTVSTYIGCVAFCPFEPDLIKVYEVMPTYLCGVSLAMEKFQFTNCFVPPLSPRKKLPTIKEHSIFPKQI